MRHESLPVVIIGAGPVGLAAAAHALSRNLTPLVLETGGSVGAGIRQWGHVRMFSPWRFNVDSAAVTILARHGWSMPDVDAYPTGHEFVESYLVPLSQTTDLRPHIRTNARVAAVTRQGHDLMKDGGRSEAPFVVRVAAPDGEKDVLAQAVIDASGTIEKPGALGASGVPALGERALSDRIFYGMPDVLGTARGRYANRRVLVVGSGHSAFNALLDLTTLSDEEPGVRILWAIRRLALGQLPGGARADQLEERGRLGSRVRHLLDQGRIDLIAGFPIDRVAAAADGIVVSAGERSLPPVDEVIAATGFRPDWTILSEVRLDLDPAVESPRALAPLIDPNVHSCGTVPPHGAEELKQPDSNLFVIGMKSYGRAPTFLMLTGYEQARSVVSAIAGDWDAARRVELVLPETGVCSTDRTGDAAPSSCCGTAPVEPVPVALVGLSAAPPPLPVNTPAATRSECC
jgi:thioredoxin reductase